MSGAVVLVTWAGEASGAAAAAAAVACAGSSPDSAGLLVDLSGGRTPRPALMATAASRDLEERLAVHIPRARGASRGQLCHLALPPDEESLEDAAGALALARDSIGVLYLPPELLQPALLESGIRLSAALLRADLGCDRALTALTVRCLIERGLRVAILKAPLAWVPSRRALFGALPAASAGGVPPWILTRLLAEATSIDSGPSSLVLEPAA